MARNKASQLLANVLGSLIFMVTALIIGVGIFTLVSTWQSKQAKFIHQTGTVELVETRWWGYLQNHFEPVVERYAYDQGQKRWSRIDEKGQSIPLDQSIAVDLK